MAEAKEENKEQKQKASDAEKPVVKAGASEEKKQEASLEPVCAPTEFKYILGRKMGMTQVFDEAGNSRAASIVEAGPCIVTNIRTSERDGYRAICLGFKSRKVEKLSKSLAGQFKDIPAPRYVKEYRVEDVSGFEVGQTVSLKDRFALGDYVDVQGVTKGKGFAGPMKRHGFSGLPASHGASDKERSPGSIGSQRSLGRVIPGQKMGGHMGHKMVTVSKVEVVKVDIEKNLIYVNGSVPGASGTVVTVLETSKNRKKAVKPKALGKTKGAKKIRRYRKWKQQF